MEMKLKGYTGSILEVRLDRRAYSVRQLKETIYANLIGGKGIGAYILLNEIGSQVVPLSEKNALVFASAENLLNIK